MQIQRGAFAGFLLSLFGNRIRGLRLDETGLVVLGRRHRRLAFSEIAKPATIRRGFLFPSLSLHLAGRSRLKLSGVGLGKATAFAAALNRAWLNAIRAWLDANAEEIDTLSQVVERLEQPRRYPAACVLAPFLERADELFSSIPINIPEEAMTAEEIRALGRIARFRREPERLRDGAAADFVEAEMRNMSDFFDRIESNPLTPEQREAVVTDEDATLVLAGAGSGKTSVITAKAAYLVKRKVRPSDEILMLAFNKGAAKEMAERIEQRCGAPVKATTFHALAYGIIGKVEGEKPALAPHASDDRLFPNLMREILSDLALAPGEVGSLVIRWFAEFFHVVRSEWDFASLHEYYTYVEDQELRTLQGERVKGFGELHLANWLYLNGIAYEYEPEYEPPLPGTGHRAYTPDFRLTDSGVYIEHFGVWRERGPHGRDWLTTAPHVDRDKYLEGMEWKRKVHAEHGTTLIETYSYEHIAGRLPDVLAERLAPYVTLNPVPAEQVFERLAKLGQVDTFTGMLGTFLRHFKGSRRTIEECRERSEAQGQGPRGRAFLDIFEAVFSEYQRHLGTRIDFEDMINLATDKVRSQRYASPYRHLLVDEFQDISQGRAELLRALKNQHGDARIFAVGDDWQAIYRFAGSDIRLMRDFPQEFGGSFAGVTDIHRTVDLGRTFRSVDRIALPARDFVLKNPSQITKEIATEGRAREPAIRVAYSERKITAAELPRILAGLGASPSGGSESVLLLGRYKHLRPDNMPTLEREHPGLSIDFKTIHSSKGLEADHVIILGAESGRFGLPSEIADDPVLDIVLPEPEEYTHAEERRVFYVALTRAKRTVTILAPLGKRSSFVRELVENDEYGVVELDHAVEASDLPCRACGGRLIPRRSREGRLYFACEHRLLCGATRPSCSECRDDVPKRSASEPGTFVCSCSARFPACPVCQDGWLVERAGKYGKFLGCVNYPSCMGKPPPKPRTRRSRRRDRPRSR